MPAILAYVSNIIYKHLINNGYIYIYGIYIYLEFVTKDLVVHSSTIHIKSQPKNYY